MNQNSIRPGIVTVAVEASPGERSQSSLRFCTRRVGVDWDELLTRSGYLSLNRAWNSGKSKVDVLRVLDIPTSFSHP